MKILVIGGGIAGPTFCLFCQKFNLNADITLIERAPEFKNLGYAISLWGNGRKILDKLDVVKNIDDKEGYQIPWGAGITSNNHRFIKAIYLKIFNKSGPIVSVTRAALQGALIKSIDKSRIKMKLGTTCKILENNEDGVLVELSDGTKERFHLLIAADGVKSEVRENIFGKGFLKPYGVAAWMFWLPQSFHHPSGGLWIATQKKLAFIYPIFEKAFLLLMTRMEPGNIEPPEDRKKKILETFSDFDKDILDIVKNIEDSTEIFRDDLRHVVMKDWFKGRVILIGDAQHAMSPLTGMGASLAMEDAYVLADELSKDIYLDAVLKRFVKRRTSRIERFKKVSQRLDGWFMANGFRAYIRDAFLRLVPGSYLTSGIEKLLEEEV